MTLPSTGKPGKSSGADLDDLVRRVALSLKIRAVLGTVQSYRIYISIERNRNTFPILFFLTHRSSPSRRTKHGGHGSTLPMHTPPCTVHPPKEAFAAAPPPSRTFFIVTFVILHASLPNI